MGRKKSHGRGRGLRHKDSGVPISLSAITRSLATEQEIKNRLEMKEAREARKFREKVERREAARKEWEAEKLARLSTAGLAESALERFRPQVRGSTFAERLEDERQQFDAWLKRMELMAAHPSGYQLSIGGNNA